MLIRGLLGDVVTEGYAAFAASVKNASGVQLTPQTPEASIAAQLKLIDRLDASTNGLFLSHKGVEYGYTK